MINFTKFRGLGSPKLSFEQAAAGSQGSGGRINRHIVQWRGGPEWPLVWPVMAIFGPTVHPTEGHPV